MDAQEIIVKGRVQGVFFRKYTQQKALELGIKGYVKNQQDSSVFICAEGTQEQLEALIKWCWKGSPLSNVIEVTQQKCALQNFQSFEIRQF